jgi:hypothetical protein
VVAAVIVKSCTVCGRPGASRCAAHPKRNAYASPLYRRNRRIVLATATVCWRCGGGFTDEDRATCGHVVPVDRGGTDALGNLAAEHESCNARAGQLQQQGRASR